MLEHVKVLFSKSLIYPRSQGKMYFFVWAMAKTGEVTDLDNQTGICFSLLSRNQAMKNTDRFKIIYCFKSNLSTELFLDRREC